MFPNRNLNDQKIKNIYMHGQIEVNFRVKLLSQQVLALMFHLNVPQRSDKQFKI